MAIIIDTGNSGDRSYSQLSTQIAKWMNRGDLATFIPDFVTNAEARIATDLRLRRMIVRTTLAVSIDSAAPLPEGWLEFETIALDGDDLDFMPMRQLTGRFRGCSGVPACYSIEGEQIFFGPSPDGAYSVDVSYYKQLESLASSGTNWLLTAKPNLYLYAALAEASLFVKKPDDANYWGGLYSGLVEALQVEDDAATSSGGALRVRAK
ncbi:phage adaptor protein [Variovorax sp.]|uniref:phage adaptor protein n=1 Tax=Variovorax sp. TaxID=1871043 RepID=UPI003BA8E695